MSQPGSNLPATRTSAPSRFVQVDFWRGFVLCVIFINHVPGNVFERLTPKNLGYSDSAEAFVFLSGVSLALAYAPRFATRQVWPAVHSLCRRTASLYGIHVLLSLAAVAIYALGADLGGDETLMDVHGRDLFTDDPGAALGGLLSLGHQLGYFNILPLYIVLMAFLVAQLALARVGIGVMLGASLAVYGAARLGGCNIPTWPMKGTWFFNPLAWQLLMALGVAAVALHRRQALRRVPMLGVAAGLVVAGSAFALTDGLTFLPGLQDWTHRWLDLDKTSLGLGRLVHFLALAYLIYGLAPARSAVLAPFGRVLCLFGRHSLMLFIVLSLLAAVGQVVTTLAGHGVVLDSLVIGGGLAVLFGVARLIEARDVSLLPVRARLGAARR